MKQAMNDRQNKERRPSDGRFQPAWILEEGTSFTSPLTMDGLENIARHQYKAGTYSRLDDIMNPMWTALTEFLPMTLAANTVTSLGGMFCLASYVLTWIYTPNLDARVPGWLHAVNALCLVIYYTLDCMDGKQARRTGTSSPLGQLWDHGIDCICVLSHVTSIMAWLQMNVQPHWMLLAIQSALQYVWFVAQWEEYYTGVLMHSTGQIGITELLYGLALMTLANSCIVDPSVYSMALADLLSQAGLEISPFLHSILTSLEGTFGIEALQLNHCLALGWYAVVWFWVTLSISRVMFHLQTPQCRWEALTKLMSPTMLLTVPVFVLPANVLEREMRYVLLGVGLALCLLSIKLIVLGMAKQSYAVVQLDCLPLVATVLWTIQLEERSTSNTIRWVWQLTNVWYLLRLIWWVHAAVAPICQRLDIEVFRIKEKRERD